MYFSCRPTFQRARLTTNTGKTRGWASPPIAPSLILQVTYLEGNLRKIGTLNPYWPWATIWRCNFLVNAFYMESSSGRGWSEWINLTPQVADRATSLRVCDRSPKHAKEWSQSGTPEFIPKNESPQPPRFPTVLIIYRSCVKLNLDGWELNLNFIEIDARYSAAQVPELITI